MNAINDFLVCLFTGNDDSRPAMMFPNLKDGIMYATNGHVMIAIPQEELALNYKTNEKFPDAEKVFSTLENSDSKKSVKVNVSDLAKELAKSRLETDKYIVKCKECGGKGEVEWKYDDKEWETHYKDFECPVCDGDGEVEKRHPFPRILISNYDNKDADIRIKIGDSHFYPLQLYRIFMVAIVKGMEEIEFFYINSEGGFLALIGNIRMLIMSLAKD